MQALKHTFHSTKERKRKPSTVCNAGDASTRKMSCKRKLTSADIERELAQDTDSECDSEIGEFLGPDEEDEGGGSEPGTSGVAELEGNIEGEAGPSGSRSPTWGSRISNLSPLKFTGNQRGVRKEGAPSINKDSTSFSILMLYFAAIIPLLVEQTNLYYRQYFDKQDDDDPLLPLYLT
ncbi:hypothetical protein C0J52_05462 [Blattella germanica]|nr:hypothetical protein C0J52_05462 [Blattella germanica]